MHTFAAFDSSYVVCVTATNHCGTWTYCDTISVDSNLWGGGLYTGNGNNSAYDRDNAQRERSLQIKQSIEKGMPPITLMNYPNPFGHTTVIDYQIWQSFTTAELKITNVFDQEIFSKMLTKPMDKIDIDGSALHDGLYYYSIIIDGSVKQTKSMAVIH